jgi:predicted metalloprotease
VRLRAGGLVVLILLSLVVKRDFLGLAKRDAIADDRARRGTVPRDTLRRDATVEDSLGRFVSLVLDEAQATWAARFRADGRMYSPALLTLHRGDTPLACGTGESASGPFYCPVDQTLYLDLGFIEALHHRAGTASNVAQAYLVTHTLGHHVQTITGTSQQVRQMQRRTPAQAHLLAVQLELQADCLAGVWAHAADPQERVEPADLADGMAAVAAVGEDRWRGGRAPHESFTHGSAAERVRWYRRGYESGDPDACDTFNPQR